MGAGPAQSRFQGRLGQDLTCRNTN